MRSCRQAVPLTDYLSSVQIGKDLRAGMRDHFACDLPADVVDVTRGRHESVGRPRLGCDTIEPC